MCGKMRGGICVLWTAPFLSVSKLTDISGDEWEVLYESECLAKRKGERRGACWEAVCYVCPCPHCPAAAL